MQLINSTRASNDTRGVEETLMGASMASLFTPPKFDIHNQNSFIWKEILFPKHHISSIYVKFPGCIVLAVCLLSSNNSGKMDVFFFQAGGWDLWLEQKSFMPTQSPFFYSLKQIPGSPRPNKEWSLGWSLWTSWEMSTKMSSFGKKVTFFGYTFTSQVGKSTKINGWPWNGSPKRWDR